jgi:hypothetical protein
MEREDGLREVPTEHPIACMQYFTMLLQHTGMVLSSSYLLVGQIVGTVYGPYEPHT